MRVSVLICTRNRPDTLPRALRSVLSTDPGPDEVLVVDQGDDPERTLAQVSTLDPRGDLARVLRDPGVGLSRARNLGWRAARGDVVAYTDDDAFVDPEWVGAIRAAFSGAEFRTGVAGGRVVPVYEGGGSDFEIPPEWTYLLPEYDRGTRAMPYPQGELPAGVSLAVWRHLLEGIGGFEENIGVVGGRRVQIYGEDSELALRVAALGYDVVYYPDMRVYHPVPRARQNQAFLNRRLFSQGATDLYLSLRRGGRRPRRLARLLLRKPGKLLRVLLLDRTRVDPVRYQGRRAYVAGELYMLAKYGLFGSERFR